MTFDFSPPGLRATASDLTVQVSPLGLVELADEEFEVHGPRLQRYGAHWAFYLGHHWAYRREAGEPQLTYNYVKAFTDYLINFCFSRGVTFRTPKETEAIVPDLLRRVWEVDNDKQNTLSLMGQQGGVSGDCFVKVAYEDPHMEPAGPEAGMPLPPGVTQRFVAGRVRILPLSSAYCFPEWHPHDRDRLIRFKQKYRFWGCLDPETEALTRRGWMTYDQITTDDEILTIDPATDEVRWAKPSAVNVYDYDGEMVRWSGRVDAFATPNHRWLGEVQRGRNETLRYERQTIHGEFVREVRTGSRLVTGGGTPLAFSDAPKWSDELVETVGWYVTEGSDHVNQTGYHSVHLSQKGERGLADIRRLASWWREQGGSFSEGAPKRDGVVEFYLGKGVVEALREAAPGKALTPEFVSSLTYAQAVRLRDVLLDADGCRTHGDRNTVRWTQIDRGRRDAYQMLTAMLGIRSAQTSCGEKVQEYASRYTGTRSLNETREHYTGKVWCPTVPTGYFMARRGGTTYWTGNTSNEGTRQVFTFTEVITDTVIEEYINDEMIRQDPNPIGTIPVVHIPNQLVAGSPWGLPDCDSAFLGLNREYNEKAAEISDIINYHAAPVTVIKGAKANQLEKGVRKVWGGLPKDADIFNLEMPGSGLQLAQGYLETIKRAMHEMVGVPETALGQVQPISNTSGVALSIQFQPLMNVYQRKIVQYGRGIQAINALILKTLAQKEPLALQYDPNVDSELRPGQVSVLDPDDPITYQSYCSWPPPLPVDRLIQLNEIQMMLGLQLESREGALRTLGEEFPDEKLAEIRSELMDDAMADGALNLVRTQIQAEVTRLTGMLPGNTDDAAVLPPPQAGGAADQQQGGDAGPPPPQMPQGELGDGPPVILDAAAAIAEQGSDKLRNALVTAAYGTTLPQRRAPDLEDR